MEETHVTTDLFTKAKEFIFENSLFKMATESKELFETVSKIIREKMSTNGFITCDNAKDIGFSNGYNTTLLARIIATFLVSTLCDINFIVMTEFDKSNLYKQIVVFLDEFTQWEECEFMYYEHGDEGIKVHQGKHGFSSSIKLDVKEKKEEKKEGNLIKALTQLNEHQALKLREDQLKALDSFAKETDEKNVTIFSDVNGIGLPRRGGNTICLTRVVASLIVSSNVRVDVKVENQTKARDFYELLLFYVQGFQGTPFSYAILGSSLSKKIIAITRADNSKSLVTIIVSDMKALDYLNENHPVKLTEDQKEKARVNLVMLQNDQSTIHEIQATKESEKDFTTNLSNLTRSVAALLVSEKSNVQITHFSLERIDAIFMSLQENIRIFEKSLEYKISIITTDETNRKITLQSDKGFINSVQILLKSSKEKTSVVKALEFINEQKQHQASDEEIKTMKLHIEKILEVYRKDETKVVQMNDIDDLNILKTIGALTRVIVALSVSEKISIQLSVSNEAVLNVAYETLKNLFKFFNHTKLVPFSGIASKSIGNTREIDVLRYSGNSSISIVVKEVDAFYQALDYFTNNWHPLAFYYSKEKVKLFSENVLRRVKDGKLTLSVSDEISLEGLVVITLSLLVSKPLKITIKVPDSKSLNDFFVHIQQHISTFNNHKAFSSQITILDVTMKRLSLRNNILSESFLEVVIIGPKPLRKLSFGKKQNDAVKVALQTTVVKEPLSLVLEKDTPFEIALEKIHTNISPKLKEPVIVLFSFIYGKVPKVGVKELDGKLSLQLNDGLSLMIEDGKVIFKSFISETFIYPSQYDKIIIALNLYFNAKI